MIALKLTTLTGGERYLLAKEVRRGPLCIAVNIPTGRGDDWWIISPEERTRVQLFHNGQPFSELELAGGGDGDSSAKLEADQTVVIKEGQEFVCDQCNGVVAVAKKDAVSSNIDRDTFSFLSISKETEERCGCTIKSHVEKVYNESNSMKLHVMDYVNQITTGA